MLKVKVTISDQARSAMGELEDHEVMAALRDAANEYATPILESHFEAVQGTPAGSPEYEDMKARKYGATENLVKTGRFEAAVHGDTPDRQIRVKRLGDGRYRAMVFIQRFENGVDIYGVAQNGGRGAGGRVMSVSANREGDLEIVLPVISASLVRMITRRGHSS